MANLRKNGKHSAIQNCHCCGDRLEPIFVDDHREPDTWFWLECIVCENLVCDKCKDTIENPEEFHKALTGDDIGWNCSDSVCVDCLQSSKVRQTIENHEIIAAQSCNHAHH